jgi:DNA-binding CsgD family transcriptional regulator
LGEDWQPYFDEALGLARQAADARQLTHVLGWLAFAAAVDGDVVMNRSAAEEGLALAEQTGNSHVSRLCRIWLGQILVCQGDLHRARSLYYDLIAEAEAETAQVEQMLGLFGLGITLACLGQADEARAAGEASMAIGDDLAGNAGTFDCYTCLAYAAMASGDTATLRETSQAGRHLINTWLEAGTLRRLAAGTMRRFSAEADLAAGELAAARQHADAAIAAATRPAASARLMGALLVSARVAAEEGDALRAHDEACQALTMGHSIEARLGIIEGLECLGTLTHGTEDLHKRARLLGAADALRQRIGYRRFLLHQARYDAAVQALLSSLGDEAFAAAWDEGAALVLDEAVSYALRGRGHRNRPRVGWLSLTPAERDVARLVPDGLSNTDIADRLFVSPRTVQTHLTHIYRKLGITSRVQLAQQASRRTSGS